MKTALVAMTIVGCDCDAKLCEYIGETPAKWATIADCEAAMKSQMLHQRNFNYPLVSGICRVKGSASSSELAAKASRPDLKPRNRVVETIGPLPPELDHRPSVPVGGTVTASETEAAKPVAFDGSVDGGRAVLTAPRPAMPWSRPISAAPPARLWTQRSARQAGWPI